MANMPSRNEGSETENANEIPTTPLPFAQALQPPMSGLHAMIPLYRGARS
jgi:hypothetical protein